MGFSSQAGHVAFRTQSAYNTFPADFNSAAIAMKLRTGSLSANRELLIPDPEIGGGRDIVDAYLGAVVWSGDYEFYARFDGLMTLLAAGLGEKYIKTPGGTNEVTALTGTTVTAGTYTITYSAQVTSAIPWNAGPAVVQAALEALSNIAPGDVFVTGPSTGVADSGVLTLTWGGTLVGNITPPTVDVTSLTGTIAVTTPTAGTDYTVASTHTFLPSDAAQLPFLGIEEEIGAGLEVFRYTDAVVNTLHFEAEANGFLMGTAGMIARFQQAGQTPIPGVESFFDNLPMVVGTNIGMTYAGLTLPAKSFSFDLTNNFEDDDFRLGSFYVGDLTPKRRELTLGCTIREQDSDLWRQATYGLSAATEAGGVTTKSPLVITMSTYEVIPGATPGGLKYSMKFTVPYVALKPYTLEASGDDIIDSDIEFQALRPYPNERLIKVEVTTDRVAVA